MKRHIPNLLTAARLVLCLVMFAGFAVVAAAVVQRTPIVHPRIAQWLIVVTFVLAAVTDFFDGYLARRWNVVSTVGAILDPIADKVLVCGAIVGLATVSSTPEIMIPGGVILFREFAVSAMREVLAPRGIKLPVTFLAKAKTTLQLVALAALMILLFWNAWGVDLPRQRVITAMNAAQWLFYLAAIVTVWTGVEYALAAAKALKEPRT